jgi:hypothetical protein
MPCSLHVAIYIITNIKVLYGVETSYTSLVLIIMLSTFIINIKVLYVVLTGYMSLLIIMGMYSP